MSDLFQRDVPDAYIRRVVNVMLTAHWHTYQVLTKRADRMHDLLQGSLRDAAEAEHIWWGVSVEDRKYGVPRIDLLRRAPGRTRFLSIEPLLEGLGELALEDIHWVIAGGESGRGARPMDPQWVRDIRDQCAAADVPFFFKQWGGVQKGRAGRLLDGRTHDGMPPRAPSTVPPRAERRGLSAALLVMGEPALIPVTALRDRAQTAATPAA